MNQDGLLASQMLSATEAHAQMSSADLMVAYKLVKDHFGLRGFQRTMLDNADHTYVLVMGFARLGRMDLAKKALIAGKIL